MSLEISTEANLKLLRDTSPDGFEVLHLISCLKDGIRVDQLSELFKKSVAEMTDIVNHIDDLSLFEESFRSKNPESHKKKIKLNPYLIDFCQKNLDK